uniref:Uncharacterized protein n=1 Tax=Arundo donax TaxID=35708 RepID=A0A0A9GPN7_ARUDO
MIMMIYANNRAVSKNNACELPFDVRHLVCSCNCWYSMCQFLQNICDI